MAFDFINAAATVLALGLSGLALWRQRPMPRMEGQLMKDRQAEAVAVAVRNSGNTSAKAPWFLIANGQVSVNAHVGVGFLGAEDGRYATTDVPMEMMSPEVVDGRRVHNFKGVVGCVDRKGRHLVWSFEGGKPKRRGKGTSFEELFRLFYPEIGFGRPGGVKRDVKLS